MKRFMRRICILAFVILCCTNLAVVSSATDRASSYISMYNASVAPAGSGKVDITVTIVATKQVSELGASYILLEESDDGGRTWNTAKEYEDESWMFTTNRPTYTRTVTYQGTIGHQYRVTANVYAKDTNGSDSRTTPTSPVITATR